MSFVDLLGRDVWTEADIVARTEALLHSEVSRQEELILSRKMIAFSMGRLVPNAEEGELLGRYELAAYLAQQEGIAARADMALLQGALDVEVAQSRLARDVEPATVLIDDIETPNPDAEQDASERAAAQATIDAGGADVLALVELRRPPPAPEPIPEPEQEPVDAE